MQWARQWRKNIYSQIHETLTHTLYTLHANYHTKIARKSITGISYAVSTTLYDSTDSRRIPRDLSCTWSIREPVYYAFRDTPNSRETNGLLSIYADVTASVAPVARNSKIDILGQGPRENKWAWRQNGQITDGIAYKLKMGIGYIGSYREVRYEGILVERGG